MNGSDPGPAISSSNGSPTTSATAPSTDRPGLPYHRALVGHSRPIARGILAIALVLVGLFGIGGAVTWVGAQIDAMLGMRSPTVGGQDYTVVFHASNTLGIALLIPWAMVVQRLLYGIRGGTLWSVTGAVRFEVIGRWLVTIGPVAVLTMALLTLITPTRSVSWSPAQLTGVVTVTLLLTPLQAAAEEVGFRGLVLRSAATWGRGDRSSLVIGVAVSTALFAVMHPPTNVWLTLTQTGLGVGTALVTWRTGGLEVAIVLHAANNVLSQLFAQALHADLLDRTVHPTILLTLAPTVVATIAVFVRTTGASSPVFAPGLLARVGSGGDGRRS